MWEIKCIVGDKKALEVMRLLKGNTLEPPVMQYVEAIVPDGLNGKSHGAVPETSVQILRQFIVGKKIVTSKQLREHCESNGYSQNGYSYALKRLQEENLLKKTKEPHTYEVLR